MIVHGVFFGVKSFEENLDETKYRVKCFPEAVSGEHFTVSKPFD